MSIILNHSSAIQYQMEEDEEFIKKLMHLMGSGKQLKLKSNNGQTIRVTLDGSSNNETEASIDKKDPDFDSPPNIKQHTAPEVVQKINPGSKQQEREQFFSESLEQIKDDFKSLSKIKERATPHENIFNEDDFDHLIKMDLQKLNEKESNISVKTQDHVFSEFINQIEPKRENKPKKISLANKTKKVSNQPVINFFKEQQNNLPSNNEEKPLKTNLSNSSPLIEKTLETEEKINSKSETIMDNINLLKERHPEDQKTIQMISERLHQLQQKSKMMDQSLSLLNSSISNSMTISMLSMNQNSDDPLCHIMSQFLNRARLSNNKKKSKKIPSSFLFMYSQPLIGHKGRQIQEQINYFEEEQIIQKTLKEGKCKVDYIHQPATIDKLHYWIKQGLQILHFSGHGVKDKNQQGNYLLFENQKGQSVKVTASGLTQLLKEDVQSLKLVFVASCHSQSAGKVFNEAGASHVICIRDEYRILDEACQQFVKLFYLTCINSKTTICQSFEFAKKQLSLKGKFTKHECEKFIILKDHLQEKCQHYFQHRNEIEAFNDLNPHPCYNKYMLSRVEHYIPRCRQMYEILQLIAQKRRFITITGQSGIGKSTIVRELVRYIQFRNYFKHGVVFLELSRCENMGKIYEVLDLQLFQTPQLRLNKSPAQNMLRLVKELSDKNLLLIFDNCQNIMASEDRDNFKKLTQNLMKTCKDLVFIFTCRHSIGRQIDYCSQVLYEVGKLSISQAKTLFFNKISRNINKQEFDQFYELESNFFNFLNGHPEAICMTASLLTYRNLKQLYEMLLKPSIGKEMNQDISEDYNPNESINKVVSTAIRISLNVIKHKHKDAAEMVKVLSLLPNGLDSQMMSKLFQSGKWKQTVRKLIIHSLVQCIEKGGSKYYLLHPHIIVQVEKEMSQQQKIKFHDRICEQLSRRIKKVYENVGTLSSNSQKHQEAFLFEEDNYKVVLLRQLSFIGQKFHLKKFYENIFKVQFQGYDEEEENDMEALTLTNTQILANYDKNNKKLKAIQLQKSPQKKEAVDIIIVYYITILFVVKKVRNTSIETYLNYGFIIAQKKNKYLVFANLLRIKACILLVSNRDSEAKSFFGTARAQFAQVGCGLGDACCQAAIGYIKYCESQYASAKLNLDHALKYYDEISHDFGKHYLNRWLCSLKSKMNREEKQVINHKLEAQKLLKEAKAKLRANNLNNVSIARHKLGCCPFRFLFDNISLFLQATFEVDLKPKFINPNMSKLDAPILKDNKKNLILNQIHEESPHSLPNQGHSTGFSQPKSVADFVLKKKEVPRKVEKKKIGPVKQISKDLDKIESQQP